MTATIYKIPIPEATVPTEQDALGTELSEQGVPGSDAIVEALSSQAADLTLTGRYAFGRYHSELVATELEELADSTLSGVPLYGGSGNRAGYYQIENAQVEPVHAGGRDIWEWTLSLTSAGTRKSQFQALDTTSQPDSTYPFGNDTTALVGVPAAARLVRAIDSTSSPTQRVQPTPVKTAVTEFGDVELYDSTALSIDGPVFIYDVAKDAQPAVDVRVYDTRGRDSKYIKSDIGRVRAWQSVYARDHEFLGSVVLSNGLLRLTIDEPTNADATATLSADRWTPPTSGYGSNYGSSYGTASSGDGSWSAVSLPATDWEPRDVDLIRIGRASIRAQIEFENTSNGDIYAFNLVLSRGYENAQWFIPDGESTPAPSGLVTHLDPIADASEVDVQHAETLVARDDIRK